MKKHTYIIYVIYLTTQWEDLACVGNGLHGWHILGLLIKRRVRCTGLTNLHSLLETLLFPLRWNSTHIYVWFVTPDDIVELDKVPFGLKRMILWWMSPIGVTVQKDPCIQHHAKSKQKRKNNARSQVLAWLWARWSNVDHGCMWCSMRCYALVQNDYHK